MGVNTTIAVRLLEVLEDEFDSPGEDDKELQAQAAQLLAKLLNKPFITICGAEKLKIWETIQTEYFSQFGTTGILPNDENYDETFFTFAKEKLTDLAQVFGSDK